MADKLMTDDAVIKLLQDEAKSASTGFRSQGLGAYLPRRSTSQAPKANTRFLRNILRETDSHNQALLAKEAEDAQARLKALKRKEERLRQDDREERHRSVRGHDEDEERYRAKRRRVDKVDRDINRLSPPEESHRYADDRPSRRRRSRSRSRSRSRGHERRRDRQEVRSKSRERRGPRAHRRNDISEEEDSNRRKQRSRRACPREDSKSDGEAGSSWHHKRSRRRSKSRDRSSSPDASYRRRRHHDRDSSKDRQRRHEDESRKVKRPRSHDDKGRRRSSSRSQPQAQESRSRKHYRSPSRSSERSASRTPTRKRRHDRGPSRSKATNGHRHNSPPKSKAPTQNPYDSEDSDPLEDIVGPMPPRPPPKVQVRGRGAISGAAGMDSRFSSAYDPSADVALDPQEEDDWGQALEALQARAKFKQSQGNRLRAAGFTEDEIKSWEKGGEKNEDDVRWAKLGEGREWDRGKVLDDDGKVQVDMDFGRLK